MPNQGRGLCVSGRYCGVLGGSPRRDRGCGEADERAGFNARQNSGNPATNGNGRVWYWHGSDETKRADFLFADWHVEDSTPALAREVNYADPAYPRRGL